MPGVILFRRSVSAIAYGRQARLLVDLWREAEDWDWADRIDICRDVKQFEKIGAGGRKRPWPAPAKVEIPTMKTLTVDDHKRYEFLTPFRRQVFAYEKSWRRAFCPDLVKAQTEEPFPPIMILGWTRKQP